MVGENAFQTLSMEEHNPKYNTGQTKRRKALYNKYLTPFEFKGAA